MFHFSPIMFIMYSQIFKVLFFISLFLFEVITFDVSAANTIKIFVAAIGGALVLAYFETTRKNWIDTIIKSLLSSCASLILTPAFIKYFNMQEIEYVSLTYFLSSLIILILLKALVVFTQQNASEMIVNIFTKFVTIQQKPSKRETREKIQSMEIK